MKIFLQLLFAAFFVLSCSRNNDHQEKNSGDSIQEAQKSKTESHVLELNGAQAKEIVLNNGLKVILISSPTSKMAAAAVGVKVGHRDNPAEFQGLAHFLEHMLFLGSKEFPVVGDYFKFIESNGGGSNAYTSVDHTNYFFQIRAEKFEEGVHQLSRFFVSPLFDSTYVEREKNAVHNEYNLRLNAFKAYRPSDAFLKENDPNRLFPVGNNITLKNATAEDTKKMFEEYYYAQAMQVVLAGPESLVDLEVLARKYFSDVKSKNQSPKKYEDFLEFDFSELPAQVNMKSSGEEKTLTLSFPIKSPKVENQKLLNGLTLILGDESENSLMVKLQNMGWLRPGANVVSGGASNSGLGFTLELSDLGFKEYKKVINYVKGYLVFLTQSGLPSYLNEELNHLDSLSARSVEYFELDANIVQTINRKFFGNDWLPENWQELFLGQNFEDIKSEDYKDYLGRILYDKVFVQLVDPSFENVSVDYESYKNLNQGGIGIADLNGQKVVVDYLYNFAAPIQTLDPKSFIAEGEFKLKEENAYIPESFEVYQSENIDPYSKIEGPWGSFRYNSNSNVSSSKVYLTLDLNSSAINFNDPKDVASLYLFREMIRNQTASKAYAMKTANFEIAFPISIEKGVISLGISGWSDTFIRVFQDSLALMHFSLTDDEFSNLKNFYIQKLKMEESSGELDSIGNRTLFSLMTPIYLNYDVLYRSFDSIDKTSFESFIARYFSAFNVEGILTGNLKKTYVADIINSIEKNWDPNWNLKKITPESKMNQVDEHGKNILLETEIEGTHPQNSLYTGYLNFGKMNDSKEKWLARILGQWISSDYFEELRTQRQLAYSLYAMHSPFGEDQALRLSLLSSTHTADQIESEVDGYIRQWTSEVLPLKSDKLLQDTKANIKTEFQIPSSSVGLHTLVSSLHNLKYENLVEVQNDLKVLDTITTQDVVDFGRRQILEKPKSGAFIKIKRHE